MGGVVFDSEGNKSLEYSWGLGNNTNNQGEALTVSTGMYLIPTNNSIRLIAIGDFDRIIKRLRRLVKNPHPNLM